MPVPRLALHTFKGNRKAYYLGDELAKLPGAAYGSTWKRVTSHLVAPTP